MSKNDYGEVLYFIELQKYFKNHLCKLHHVKQKYLNDRECYLCPALINMEKGRKRRELKKMKLTLHFGVEL